MTSVEHHRLGRHGGQKLRLVLGEPGVDLNRPDAVVVWRIVAGRLTEAWDIPAVNTARPQTS